MKEFMGIKNVVDAQPILGKDGMVDGFYVFHEVDHKVKMFGKTHIRKDIGRSTIWVRDYELEPVKKIRTTSKKVSKKKEPNLSAVQRILGGK